MPVTIASDIENITPAERRTYQDVNVENYQIDCHVRHRLYARWGEHVWGHSFQPNFVTGSTTFTQNSEENLNLDQHKPILTPERRAVQDGGGDWQYMFAVAGFGANLELMVVADEFDDSTSGGGQIFTMSGQTQSSPSSYFISSLESEASFYNNNGEVQPVQLNFYARSYTGNPAQIEEIFVYEGWLDANQLPYT